MIKNKEIRKYIKLSKTILMKCFTSIETQTTHLLEPSNPL